ANAPIITSMMKTRPNRDKDDTLRIPRRSAHLGAMFGPREAGRNEIQPMIGLRRAARLTSAGNVPIATFPMISRQQQASLFSGWLGNVNHASLSCTSIGGRTPVELRDLRGDARQMARRAVIGLSPLQAQGAGQPEVLYRAMPRAMV